MDNDYDYKKDDHAPILHLAILYNTIIMTTIKALELANYVIKLENKFLSTYEKTNNTLSTRDKMFLEMPTIIKAF